MMSYVGRRFALQHVGCVHCLSGCVSDCVVLREQQHSKSLQSWTQVIESFCCPDENQRFVVGVTEEICWQNFKADELITNFLGQKKWTKKSVQKRAAQCHDL